MQQTQTPPRIVNHSVALLARLGVAAAPRPLASPERAPGDDIGMGALLHFKSLMAAEGHPVHVARMCYDRNYAYEQIANAHASAQDGLRRVALELFQTFHRRDEARRLAA